MPRIRITQILAALGVLLDVMVRVVTRNLLGPAYIDILPALLIGYCLGRRPTISSSKQNQKSKWIRLS
jgi:hypothetical protein